MLSFQNDVSPRGTHRVLVTILDEAEASVKPQAVDTLPLGEAGPAVTSSNKLVNVLGLALPGQAPVENDYHLHRPQHPLAAPTIG